MVRRTTACRAKLMPFVRRTIELTVVTEDKRSEVCRESLGRTVTYSSKVRQNTICVRTTWCSKRWFAGIIASQEQEVLELRRSKIESGETIVALEILLSACSGKGNY